MSPLVVVALVSVGSGGEQGKHSDSGSGRGAAPRAIFISIPLALVLVVLSAPLPPRGLLTVPQFVLQRPASRRIVPEYEVFTQLPININF